MDRINTLIELYDPSTHLYNALGVMLYRPYKVIFLIPEHSAHIYEKYKNEYVRLWKKHGCAPDNTISVLTGTSNIIDLAETIKQFCEDDTVLDVEGGTPELYLAAGFVCASRPCGVSCVRIDFRDEKLTEYCFDGSEPSYTVRSFTKEESERLSISVEDCIRIYGGEVVRDAVSELIALGMTKEHIISEAQTLWEAVTAGAGKGWNDIVPDRFHVHDTKNMTVYVKDSDMKLPIVSRAVTALSGKGLLRKISGPGSRYFYKCSSPLVLSALRKAGEALELYTLSLALSIDGVNDAISGVSISFDDGEGSSDNEIDCIFMRGSTPVFISCKNGHFGSDELYKFFTVSRQFGGNERISLLVAANYSENGKKSAALRDRAELYGISLITEFSGKSHVEMTKALREKTDEKKKKLRR